MILKTSIFKITQVVHILCKTITYIGNKHFKINNYMFLCVHMISYIHREGGMEGGRDRQR